jgi:hypothetical protein
MARIGIIMKNNMVGDRPNILSVLYACFAAILLVHCARQGTPSGGPKDSTPPKMDTLRSTPNYTLRFQEKEIRLRFDEWITLNNPATEVTVSPPTAKKPELTLDGKTAVLRFDKAEQLRPNTTYTVNFGAAIKDFHEGNVAPDLRFVFSTGDHLDSLSLQGGVADAFTGDAVENMTVMLYENTEDSVIRKERPLYLGKTDKSGQYKIFNLRPGTYKAVAFEDNGPNDLKWSGDAEKIAFSDTLVTLRADITGAALNFKAFKNDPKLRITDKNQNKYGRVKIGFSKLPENAMPALLEPVPGLRSVVETMQDSIYFWYDIDVPVPWKLLILGDTVPVSALNRADFLKNHRVDFGDVVVARGKRNKDIAPAAIKTSTVLANKPLTFLLNSPVVEMDSSKWLLLAPDSSQVRLKSLAKSATAPRGIELTANWVPEKRHRLLILPGGIRDFYGVTNADTLRRDVQHQSEKQLGSVKLTLTDLTPGRSYVAQLLNGNTVETEQSFAVNASEHVLLFSQLPLANYSLRLIEDLNSNGRWDTGHYFLKRQPERISNKKLEALRANWELEVKASMNERENKKKK